MERTDYLSQMKAVSLLVAKRVESVVEREIGGLRLPDDMEDDLRRAMNLILSKRLGTLLQKPYIYLLCVGILGAEVDDRDYDTAAAIELLNIATYQENTALDSKFRTLTHLQKTRQYICAAMTREWASDLLGLQMPETRNNQVYPSDLMGNIYATVNAGQILDLGLTVHDIALSESEYLEKYLLRCELLSGAFNGKIASIATRMHEKKENQDLKEGLRAFGTGLQITNDFGDNIVFQTDAFGLRSYQSPFSDLRNGRLTYPLYAFFQEAENNSKFIDICQKNQDDALLGEFVRAFVQSSAVEKTKQVIKVLYRKAVSHFRCLRKSASRDSLITLTSILLWNKYFTEVRMQRGRYRIVNAPKGERLKSVE